jgi:ATP-binding cassette subfamily G (WHITE) protein 2 (PDR)
MAEANLNREGAAWTMSENNYNTVQENTQSNTFGEQVQSSANSSDVHGGGIYRTSSGRETYYPDGHASRTTGTGAGLFCEHEGHQKTPSFTPRASYGIMPLQQNHTSHVEEEVPLEAVEKIESSSSSDSSTRPGSNSQQNKKRQESDLSSIDEQHATRLERRNTRAEIDDEGRRELQRIFTTQSQKITHQISIAQPGDATVDPSNDSFDLSKFLRMFRMCSVPSFNIIFC